MGVYDPTHHTFYLNNKTSGTDDIIFVSPLIPAKWRRLVAPWDCVDDYAGLTPESMLDL